MTEADELSFHSWKAPGHDLEIITVEAVLTQIRDFAVDGYLRLARGGIEVGGILFGLHEARQIKIKAWRPIACEHANGPSFQLSAKDESGLVRLMEEARDESELRGLEPVGWFVSHTRSDISIRIEDGIFWGKYFPKSWQIALVVKPSRFQPVQAGYFFRTGSQTPLDPCLNEFVLPAAQVEKRPLREKRVWTPPPPEVRHEIVEELIESEMAVQTSPRTYREMTSKYEVPFVREELRPKRNYRRLLVVFLSVIAGSLLGVVGRLAFLYYSDTHQPHLGLSVSEVNQELRVRWNKELIREWKTSTAEIRFREANGETAQTMTAEALMLGAFSYVRKSGDVQIQLKVFRDGKSPVVELARFVGPLPATIGNKPPADGRRQVRRRRVNRNAQEAQVEDVPPL